MKQCYLCKEFKDTTAFMVAGKEGRSCDECREEEPEPEDEITPRSCTVCGFTKDPEKFRVKSGPNDGQEKFVTSCEDCRNTMSPSERDRAAKITARNKTVQFQSTLSRKW